MSENQKPSGTVGARAGVGFGVVSLGVLLVVLPMVVDSFPAAKDNPAASLAGMMVFIGVFVILAGVMSIFVKD